MPYLPDIPGAGRRVGYARVSTSDQKLEMQLDLLRQAGCAPVFQDHGISGAKGSRPGLDAMLRTISSGDTLIVYRLDRLGRSVLHLADLLVRFERQGVHFVSLTEGIDTTTPGGRMVFHIFSAVAEFQRGIIVENTLAGLQAARRKGRRLGRRPKLSARDVADAVRQIASGSRTPQDIAARHHIHPRTLKRAIGKAPAAMPPDYQTPIGKKGEPPPCATRSTPQSTPARSTP